MVHAVTPILGFSTERRTTDAELALGTTITTSDGYAHVYVQANGAIAASQTDVTVNLSTFQASDGSGTYVNTAAFADNEYGWVRSPDVVGADIGT